MGMRRSIGAGMVSLSLAACSATGGPAAPGETAPERLEIIEEEAALAHRVVPYDEIPLTLDASVTDSSGVSASIAPGDEDRVRFKLVAEVEPPTIDGVRLEATHVTLSGSKAYVSYARVGSPAIGAVDVFSISNASKPRLIASARFRDADVFTLAASGSTLYFGEGTSDRSFPTPAVVERMALAGDRMSHSTARASVPSYAATGVAVSGGRVFVASGDRGGGLHALGRNTLELVWSDPFDDARAVDASNRWLVAVQGDPGVLRVYDPKSLELRSEIRVGGLEVAGAKATVQLEGHHAFVSLGRRGTAVVNLEREEVVARLPRPKMDGVPGANSVTNAVTAVGDIVLHANGGAGVWVSLSNHRGFSQPELRLLGRIEFGSGVSANYVAAKGRTLVVAGGRAGLKIVKIEIADG